MPNDNHIILIHSQGLDLFLLNQGNALFGEKAGIQCARMTSFAISYSTIKEINRWNQSDLDDVLVNLECFVQNLKKANIINNKRSAKKFWLG